MMQDMREMMAELMRNNGPSESSSAENRPAVGGGRGGGEGLNPLSAKEGDFTDDVQQVRSGLF